MTRIHSADAKRLLVLMMDHGVKAPESYARQGGVDAAAESYAALLTASGISLPEAQAAVATYLLEADDTRFPTPWPSVGKLLARTPTARRLATFGGDLDVGAAWADFTRRRASLDRYRPESIPALWEDPDPHRALALRFALDDTGGAGAWLNHTLADAPHLERRWKDAYRAARKGQGADPEVARAIAQTARLAIGGPS